MKRMIVFAVILILAISPCFCTTAKANEIVEEENEKNRERESKDTIEEYPENDAEEVEEPSSKTGTTIEKDVTNENALSMKKSPSEISVDKTSDKADKMLSLQVPQGVEIIMDPWEMDGRKQIYSEQYIVKNCGKTTGHLVLSELACKAKTEEINIQTNKEGLHSGDDKSMYIEMVFGNGEKITLSPETSRYETDLEPGEELSFYFSGEVNENASADWSGSDIAVTIVYSWDSEPEDETELTEKAELAEQPEKEDETNTATVEGETEESQTETERLESDEIKEKKEDREEETKETGMSVEEPTGERRKS